MTVFCILTQTLHKARSMFQNTVYECHFVAVAVLAIVVVIVVDVIVVD